MSTRSLRHRSSRYSSPATFGEKEPPPKPVEVHHLRNGQQTSLDKWIEPNVRTAVPSFEDTKGLERVGVLENMQPLGVPPSHRLLQKLKLNYTRPSPRATPVQTDEVFTPLPEQEKLDSASPLEPEILRGLSPDPPRHSDTIVISSPPRGRPSRREVAEMSQASNVSPSGVRLSFTPSNHTSTKPASIQEHLRQDRINSHLELALQEAQDKGTPNLIPGLEKLREDAQLIPELYNVIEAIIQQSPTNKQFRTFKRYIKSGVKDFRRASQSQISEGSHHPSSLAEINSAFASPQDVHLPRSTHQRITSTGFTDEGNRRIALFFGQMRKEPPSNPLASEMSVSPLRGLANVNIDPALTTSQSEANTTSPNKRKRSLSAASESSLSSAQSIPDDFVPTLQQNDGQTGSGRSRSMGQRQATHRAGNRLRSAGGGINHQSLPNKGGIPPTSKTTAKKSKKTQSDPEYDIDELSRRKRNYLQDSFHDYNTIPRPESSERDISHGHPETIQPPAEQPPPPVMHPNRLISLDPALSSPVSSYAPRESMLANGTGRKRMYDELDADGIELAPSLSPSPLLVPPPPPGLANTTSRGLTPRGARFPPITRTRKSARVMVS
ncbi:uncharacterized protein A1O9_11805 [Exophiala aquamarina CBS 119918]|uniref:Uncharacterized protein n=1 Tax=Exophiala aquamarina CBS 119918 TaxID=1182545 RepID=A0A072NYT2_9EURO|nr:uncharacterized protein A1O9_11805 [Exophiala aquamarina CBS 119918]KEF52178.1 hypothetical protein A1O9_11805 [Exophiala aquamarina CBS 119918]